MFGGGGCQSRKPTPSTLVEEGVDGKVTREVPNECELALIVEIEVRLVESRVVGVPPPFARRDWGDESVLYRVDHLG